MARYAAGATGASEYGDARPRPTPRRTGPASVRADRARLRAGRAPRSTSTRCSPGCPTAPRAGVLAAFDALGRRRDGGAEALARASARRRSSGPCARSRARPSTATSSRPGARRARRLAGDRLQPPARRAAATRTGRTWGSRMSERFDVVVVGSGAGGGVVAGELAERGRRVLLLEPGPHRTAADFMRWEAHANHELWWPTGASPMRGARRAGAGRAAADRVPRPLRRRHDARSTPRSRCARRPRTTRSGTRPPACVGDGGEPFARGRPARALSSASRRGSGYASAPTGSSACTPSCPASRRWAPSSSRSCPTPTPTACAAAPACRAARPTPASRRSTPTSSRALVGRPARAARRLHGRRGS